MFLTLKTKRFSYSHVHGFCFLKYWSEKTNAAWTRPKWRTWAERTGKKKRPIFWEEAQISLKNEFGASDISFYSCLHERKWNWLGQPLCKAHSHVERCWAKTRKKTSHSASFHRTLICFLFFLTKVTKNFSPSLPISFPDAIKRAGVNFLNISDCLNMGHLDFLGLVNKLTYQSSSLHNCRDLKHWYFLAYDPWSRGFNKEREHCW